ncbi:MAG TPA: ASCH domain-containing protein [Pyrinomonadaceae bacterium]|nr:ASCH domain-containing protein [Pyrinomonadaceae bacterium]
MKALSIRQPWAWAIVHAGKDIENRDWSTKFRGVIAVHAAKGMTRNEHIWASMDIEERSGLRPPAYPMLKERGFIVGTVEIVDCVSKSPSPWFQGEYGLVLRNPVPLAQPVYIKGALGFWDVPEDIAAKLIELRRAALRPARLEVV